MITPQWTGKTPQEAFVHLVLLVRQGYVPVRWQVPLIGCPAERRVLVITLGRN